MLDDSSVPHYPWRESAKRASLAFVELRRESAVERECFELYWACRDELVRRSLATHLQDSQRAWQLASQEYTAALRAHIACLRTGVADGHGIVSVQRATISCDAPARN